MDFTEETVSRNRDLSEGFMGVFASLGQYDEKNGNTAWGSLYIICEFWNNHKTVSMNN